MRPVRANPSTPSYVFLVAQCRALDDHLDYNSKWPVDRILVVSGMRLSDGCLEDTGAG